MNTQSNNHSQEPLKTTAEISEFLSVSKSMIEKGRAAGNEKLPPFVQIGRSAIRYRMSDVLAWLETSIQK